MRRTGQRRGLKEEVESVETQCRGRAAAERAGGQRGGAGGAQRHVAREVSAAEGVQAIGGARMAHEGRSPSGTAGVG